MNDEGAMGNAERAAALHRRAIIADAHADSLMWNRDLNLASDEGHVDFARLLEAGVKLQCFTLVSRGLPWINGFPLFTAWRKWPRQARADEWARVQWQIERLSEFCRQSGGKVSIAGLRRHLDANLAAGRLSAMLGVEGAHALCGRLERVSELFRQGVRFMSLTHLANNELGGTCTRFQGNRGLTDWGRTVLEAMVGAGMAVDLAHAAPRTLAEILAEKRARVFCSHTGVVGVKRSWRNLPDDVLRQIADRGGVVGVMFAPVFLGGPQLELLVKHLEHAVSVMGEDGVGLGSDFDGVTALPKGMRDARDLVKVSEALLERGHPEERVEKLMGGNLMRFFRETLPP